MSYDVELVDAETGTVLVLPEHTCAPQGGTYVLGSTHAEFNITYNYGPKIREVLHPDGVRWLYGQRASQTIPALAIAVSKLSPPEGDGSAADYWTPTEGNVRVALLGLLALAINCPEGVWQGD
jgi:hypothetical protein